MQSFSLSPVGFIRSCWLNKSLLKTLIVREVMGRYQGSAFGLLWSFLNPLFMLIVYTFVFSVVFNAKWGTGSASKTEFALVLFAGLLVFNFFAECIGRAPSLIVQNSNYVKKVIFPLEILPVVVAGAALFHMVINLLVWLLFFLLFFGFPHLTIFYIPLVLIPLLLFTIGLSWILASLGVYLRDIGQFVSVIITALMFLSPIFYPINALPEQYQTLLLLNPLTPIIEQMRDVLFWGKSLIWHVYIVYLIGASVIAILGFMWFQRTRKGFADVI